MTADETGSDRLLTAARIVLIVVTFAAVWASTLLDAWWPVAACLVIDLVVLVVVVTLMARSNERSFMEELRLGRLFGRR
jgi:hypothetical protein